MSGNIRRQPQGWIWFIRIGPLVAAIFVIVVISRRFPQTGEAPGKAPAAVVIAPPPPSPAPAPITRPPAPVAAPDSADFPLAAATPVLSAISQDLPVRAGSASLERIARFIREDQLPSREIVRIEEMLDRFSLRPLGTAAVAKGVTLSTETLACPWKPSATLLLVSFRGAAGAAHEVRAAFTPDAFQVRRFRLLGFEPGGEQAPPSSELAAGRVTTLALEIEMAPGTSRFGTLAWSIDGHPAPPLSLVRNPDAEPSEDARFAALVCTFGQWLAGDRAGLIDAELLAALARELATADLPPERAELLDLIDRSLDL